MILQFGSTEAAQVIELISRGAGRVEVYTHFLMLGSLQLQDQMETLTPSDIDVMREALLELETKPDSMSVLAQRAMHYGALQIILGDALEANPNSPVTHELFWFLSDHSILESEEFVEGFDQIIAKARQTGFDPDTIQAMVDQRNQIAASIQQPS